MNASGRGPGAGGDGQWGMALVGFVVNRTLLRDPGGFLERCRGAAEARGWAPWFGPAGDARDSLELARRAVAAGAGLVIAAGGDGTVRACAQALAGRLVRIDLDLGFQFDGHAIRPRRVPRR